MLGRHTEWGRSLELMGLVPLRPEAAIEAVALLAGSGACQAVVADVDWPTFKSVYDRNGRRRFFERIGERPRPKRSAGPQQPGARSNWRDLCRGDRRTWLILYFRDQIGRVLGFEPGRLDPDLPLNTLGLGSLVALELKCRTEADLGLPLPLSCLFEGPTITQLADQMLDQLAEPAPPPATVLAPVAGPMGEYPLSYNQQSLWYLNKLDPANGLYHIAGAVRILSPLDVDALSRSFQRLVDRHPRVRLTFATVGDDLVQRVHESSGTWLRVEDAASWTETELRLRLEEEAHWPFDLEAGPLFRAFLFRRSDREYVLMMSVHHTICDFWSVAVVLHELGLYYPAEHSGVAVELPALEFQYTDFVRWQAEMLAGPEGESHWAYWRKQLAGRLPCLNLPTDRPRPAVESHRGAETSIVLDSGLTQKLITVGGSRGTSLYMTLLAAFQVLLGRYSGQEDFVIGLPVAGRNRPGLAGLVGDFVNTAPMRADLTNDPTFETLLTRVRQTVLDGLEHQDFPFSLLVDRLQPERRPEPLADLPGDVRLPEGPIAR